LKENRHYKYISIKELISIAEIFNSIFPTNKRKKRGRPPTYSDELIMFLFFLKVARGLSFRVLRVVYQELFGGEVPSLSTLHYRFKRLDTQRLRCMVTILAMLIEGKLGGIKREYTFCDGTGFGFEKKATLKYLRGKGSKDVKEYVKIELLVGGTSAGEMSNKVLEELFKRGFIPVIPVRDGIHMRIRSEMRYRIEQVVGKIKNSYGDKERAKSYDMPVKSVIAKVILFNWRLDFFEQAHFISPCCYSIAYF